MSSLALWAVWRSFGGLLGGVCLSGGVRVGNVSHCYCYFGKFGMIISLMNDVNFN